MTISGVTGTTGTTASTGATTRTPNDQLGKDAFLQLLVAQLKYQDPLSPTDPTQFMSQTAQFTMVEKLTELTEQGAATNQALGLSAAADLVGRTVSWIGEDGVTESGVATAAKSSIDGVTLQVDDEQIPLEAITGIS